MASIDLNGLSLPELKQLQTNVKRAIVGYSDRKKQEAISALDDKAQELGFSLADLLGTKKQRKASGAAVAIIVIRKIPTSAGQVVAGSPADSSMRLRRAGSRMHWRSRLAWRIGAA